MVKSIYNSFYWFHNNLFLTKKNKIRKLISYYDFNILVTLIFSIIVSRIIYNSLIRKYNLDNKNSSGKVYGPFRKVVFHSEPKYLFNQEFKDVNQNIKNGNSVVFFGYGFSNFKIARS